MFLSYRGACLIVLMEILENIYQASFCRTIHCVDGVAESLLLRSICLKKQQNGAYTYWMAETQKNCIRAVCCRWLCSLPVWGKTELAPTCTTDPWRKCHHNNSSINSQHRAYRTPFKAFISWRCPNSAARLASSGNQSAGAPPS